MLIKFAVKIVHFKVYIIFAQSDDLALNSRSQLRLGLHRCLTCTIIAISWIVFKLWHSPWYNFRLMHDVYAHAHFDDLDLDARSQWVDKGKNISVE